MVFNSESEVLNLPSKLRGNVFDREIGLKSKLWFQNINLGHTRRMDYRMYTGPRGETGLLGGD